MPSYRTGGSVAPAGKLELSTTAWTNDFDPTFVGWHPEALAASSTTNDLVPELGKLSREAIAALAGVAPMNADTSQVRWP